VTAPLLDVQGLDVAYGDFQVLWQAAMHVGEGEIVAVLGPNGAGKSTLMNTISGLLTPRAGRIAFGGSRIDGRLHQQVGWLDITMDQASFMRVLQAECSLPKAIASPLYGKSPFAYAKEHGLLGPDVVVAHCSLIEESDLLLLARSGAAVALLERQVWAVNEMDHEPYFSETQISSPQPSGVRA
jgi:ABC-type dipeptide/oligopeptide/nickel transport system ATPase component